MCMMRTQSFAIPNLGQQCLCHPDGWWMLIVGRGGRCYMTSTAPMKRSSWAQWNSNPNKSELYKGGQAHSPLRVRNMKHKGKKMNCLWSQHSWELNQVSRDPNQHPTHFTIVLYQPQRRGAVSSLLGPYLSPWFCLPLHLLLDNWSQ